VRESRNLAPPRQRVDFTADDPRVRDTVPIVEIIRRFPLFVVFWGTKGLLAHGSLAGIVGPLTPSTDMRAFPLEHGLVELKNACGHTAYVAFHVFARVCAGEIVPDVLAQPLGVVVAIGNHVRIERHDDTVVVLSVYTSELVETRACNHAPSSAW